MSDELKAAIRAAGGIVHGDGNIFFTNAEQFHRAAPSTQPAAALPVVPPGCQIVPVEPTDAMVAAGARSIIDGQEGRPGTSWAEEAGMAHKAMLAAAPQHDQAHLAACAGGGVTQWQPIETAPDETPVWLMDASGNIWIGERNFNGDDWLWGNCYLTIYQKSDKTWGSTDCQEDDDYQPVRWMPLPAPAPTPMHPPAK